MAEMTAAEKYATLKESAFEAFLEASFSKEALKGVPLYEVKLPIGLTIKCRKLDAAYGANTQMPITLTALVLDGKQHDPLLSPEAEEAENEKRFHAMTPMQQRAAIEASVNQVRYIAVSPRLVAGDVGDRKDAISADLLTMKDFNVLTRWAQGGDAAQGLKTFRRKRR